MKMKAVILSSIRFAALVCVISLNFAMPVSAKPVVAASTAIIGDWVREVAGDQVYLHILAPPGSDLHTFEPVPSDVRLLSRADVIFEFGLGLELWLDRITRTLPATASRRVVLADGFSLLRPGENYCLHDAAISHTRWESDQNLQKAAMATCANSADHAHHKPIGLTKAAHDKPDCANGEYDPHVWFDPTNAAVMVATIARVLAELDPANGDVYHARAEAYRERLYELDTLISQQLQAIPQERRQLVTNHDSFRYYARRYGLWIPDTLFGVSTGSSDPSARTMARMVRSLQEWGTPAVFTENTFNPSLMRQLAREARLQSPPMLYTGLSEASGPAADYMALMRYNTALIVRSLMPVQN